MMPDAADSILGGRVDCHRSLPRTSGLERQNATLQDATADRSLKAQQPELEFLSSELRPITAASP